MRDLRPLILSNSPRLAFNAATCLGDQSIQSYVMTSALWSPFHTSVRWIEHARICSDQLCNAADELAEYIERYVRRHDINAIIPGDETATRFVIKHADRFLDVLTFPTPDSDLFESLCDKWAFAQLADTCGSDHPRSILVQSIEDASKVDLGYPMIVKPIRGTSAEGVYVIDSPQTFQTYVERMAEAEQLPILAQQYLQGYDMDLTILADHGEVVAWTIQRRRFEESGVEFIIDDQMLQLGERIVNATGFHGIVDFDLRFETPTNRAYLMEANPRFPGTLRFKLAAGVNFPLMGLGIASGERNMIDSFKPVQGACHDHGLAPRAYLRSILGQSPPPGAISRFTSTAHRINRCDPYPHAALWIGSLFRRGEKVVNHSAGTLPH